MLWFARALATLGGQCQWQQDPSCRGGGGRRVRHFVQQSIDKHKRIGV